MYDLFREYFKFLTGNVTGVDELDIFKQTRNPAAIGDDRHRRVDVLEFAFIAFELETGRLKRVHRVLFY